MTPDPYQASGGPGDPGSWNRFAYTRGDPVGSFDPTGLNDSVTVYGWPDYISYNFAAMFFWGDGSRTPPRPLPLDPLSDSRDSVIALHLETLNRIQHAQAVSAVNNLSHDCQQAIAAHGIDVTRLSTTAADLQFVDVYNGAGSLRVDSFGGNLFADFLGERIRSFANFVPGTRARVITTKTGQLTNMVVLNSGYFTSPTAGADLATSQNITLVHETMHVMTGLGDRALANQLGLGPFPDDDAGGSAASVSYPNG